MVFGSILLIGKVKDTTRQPKEKDYLKKILIRMLVIGYLFMPGTAAIVYNKFSVST